MTYIINFFSFLLISIFFLIGVNLSHYVDKLRNKIEIRVFLKSDANIDAIKKEIEKIDKNAVFISQEEALAEFMKEVENGAILLQRIKKTPFPASFKISPIKDINLIKKTITKIDGIKEFVYDEEGIKKLNKINKLFLWLGLPIYSLVFIVFIFAIINTNYKREEKLIKEMKIFQSLGVNKNKIICNFRIKTIIETIVFTTLSIAILYLITRWVLTDIIKFPSYRLIAKFIAGTTIIAFIINILKKFQ